MMHHFFDALGRDASAAKHVREERPHVRGPLWATEGDDENRVERHLTCDLYPATCTLRPVPYDLYPATCTLSPEPRVYDPLMRWRTLRTPFTSFHIRTADLALATLSGTRREYL
jgi:hypothetical protein